MHTVGVGALDEKGVSVCEAEERMCRHIHPSTLPTQPPHPPTHPPARPLTNSCPREPRTCTSSSHNRQRWEPCRRGLPWWCIPRGNLRPATPASPASPHYSDATPRCCHCQTNRRPGRQGEGAGRGRKGKTSVVDVGLGGGGAGKEACDESFSPLHTSRRKNAPAPTALHHNNKKCRTA